MHTKCGAQCCGSVPLPKDIYSENQDKIVRQPTEHLDLGEAILPITSDNHCVFLKEDLSCNIYDNRPEICRKFGNESHPMLCCAFLNKKGQERSRQNRRKIERDASKYISKLRVLDG